MCQSRAFWLLINLLLLGTSASAGAPGETKSVTVRVVDGSTQKPVTNFIYNCWIHSPPEPVEILHRENIRVESAQGQFELNAPLSCEIMIEALAPDFVSGYHNFRSYTIQSNDAKRQIEVRLQRGFTLRGTITDALTKLPVAGAVVAPLVFTPPLWTPDEKREVQTDAQGHYEVRGVDSFGVRITHPDYAPDGIAFFDEYSHGDLAGMTVVRDVALEVGDVAKGVVVDPDGRPLENVQVEDFGGKTVTTGTDGRFVLKGVTKDDASFQLEFSRDGFIEQDAKPVNIPPEGLRVVLQPKLKLGGRVTDSNGNPIGVFTVCAGPGREPLDFQAISQNITNHDGRFSLALDADGTNWVGVRAAGFAFWENGVVVSRTNGEIEVRLQPGFNVSGSVTPIYSNTVVSLIPIRPKPKSLVVSGLPAITMGTLRSPVDSSGRFMIEHAKPGDDYKMVISGLLITPKTIDVKVSTSNVVFGNIVLTGVGTIRGQAFQPGHMGSGVWAFARGEVDDGRDEPTQITTDENGRFKIENVAVGTVRVSIFYMATADVEESETKMVEVSAGKSSEVSIGPETYAAPSR